MMFQQQKQDNCENENEYCKDAMILMKNKTVNDKTIITAAILQLIVQQYLLLYLLNAIYCITVKLKRTHGVVMLWCIRQKLGTCAILPKTKSDVTEQCYFISYLCA